MYNITAYLTIKNKTFYTVLTYYVDGIRKMKWVSTLAWSFKFKNY